MCQVFCLSFGGFVCGCFSRCAAIDCVEEWVFCLFATQSPFWFLLFAAPASAISYRCFRRCPCAGRHLLFFAAAKKSRQKKAALEPPVPARITARHTFFEPSHSDVRTP